MIHISLECLWKLPQPNIYLLRFTATPPELIQRGWQRIIYMLMPLFYDFFFLSRVSSSAPPNGLKRISLMKKKKKKKEARHLQSLVDSISRKKREKWTKIFFFFSSSWYIDYKDLYVWHIYTSLVRAGFISHPTGFNFGTIVGTMASENLIWADRGGQCILQR